MLLSPWLGTFNAHSHLDTGLNVITESVSSSRKCILQCVFVCVSEYWALEEVIHHMEVFNRNNERFN